MPTVTIGIFGQSFAVNLYNQQEALGAFKAEFDKAGYTVNLVTYAIGGTACLKEHAPPSNPTWYWWDYDLNEAGPLLVNALAVIDAAPVKPTKIIWAQGEQDSGFSTFNSSRFQSATHSILSTLRAACNPTYPTSTGTFLHVVGRALSGFPSVQAVREAQIELEAADTAVFGFDIYDLTLLGEDPRYDGDDGNRHMDTIGNAEMGFRAAQRILTSLSEPGRTAPQISGVTRVSSDKISLSFSSTTAIEKPTAPSHLVIRVGSDLMTGLSFAWVGDILEITAPVTIPVGAKLLTPYGIMDVVDRKNLIKDFHGQPLRSAAITIP